MTETTTTTIPALLPCPMCDEARISFGDTKYSASTVLEHGWTQNTFHFVNCPSCGLNNKGVIGHKSREDAAAAWNRRAAPSPAPAAPSAASVRDCLPAGHIIIEQADMPDGRVGQTVRHRDGSEYQRIVSADEAYGPDEDDDAALRTAGGEANAGELVVPDQSDIDAEADRLFGYGAAGEGKSNG